VLAILLPLPLSSPEPPTSDLGPSISSTPCLDAEAAAETVSAMAGVVAYEVEITRQGSEKERKKLI